MGNLVRESINFERTGDIKKSLGLGYEAKIRKFFREFDIPDEDYIVEPNKEIIFNDGIDLSDTNITWLPDNLAIDGYLNLRDTNITKLPDNLKIKGFLDISYTNLTELPNNLIVKGDLDLSHNDITELPNDLYVKKSIIVFSEQTELIEFIKNSKFANKLDVWGY